MLAIGLAASTVLAGVYFIRTGPANGLQGQFDELTEEVNLLQKNSRNGGELAQNLEKVKQYTELMNEPFYFPESGRYP